MVDLHNDFLTEVNKTTQKKFTKYFSQKFDFLCCPIWTTYLKNAKNYINNRKNIVNYYPNLQICIEDIGFLDDKDFDFLLDIMPKYVGLVWNKSNKFGGGAYDIGGLSTSGKELVNYLQANNIIVDVAHTNNKTFWNIAQITKKPIFCSHGGFCGIKNDKRNLTDRQLQHIVNTNGLVGLFFVGKYICNKKNATSDDIVKNIDYFVQKFGTKNLAIGTDFFGTTDLPVDVKNYAQIEVIMQKLQKIGYKKQNIDDIFVNNAKLFLNI